FINKVNDIWEVHNILSKRQTAIAEGVGVVTGMGGIGKTQLAIEYAHRFAMCYPGGIFWTDAERGILTLIAQVTEGSPDIQIDPALDEKQQLGQLWRALNLSDAVLIVFDNFPENETFRDRLPPSGSVHTLVTTRRRDLDYSRIALKIMTADEGVRLLNSGERQFGKEAEDLVSVSGGLPLALELVRKYLNLNSGLSIPKLIKAIKETGEIKALNIFAEKYGDELPSGHEKQVAATIEMSWKLASETTRTVLQVISILAPLPVPVRLLRSITGIEAVNDLDDPLTDAIIEADKKLSLVDTDQDNDPVMHRLITGYVRMTTDEEDNLYDKVVLAVEDEMARVKDDADTKAYYELVKIIPHAEHLILSQAIKADQAVDIANYVYRHYRKWGKYRLAQKFGRTALKIAQINDEPGHPKIAEMQSDLAMVLRDSGELTEARDLLRQALLSVEKSFEPGHPTIANRQSNLARVLHDLGKLTEARDLLRQALISDEKSFEPGHPSIAIRQSNLASVLQDLGELTEARDLLRQALLSAEKSFEPGHPKIAIRQSRLAMVLKDLGGLTEARDLLRQALLSDEKGFEPGHPSIAIRQSNLALVLQNLGELTEARNLIQRAYHTFLDKFGSEHARTIKAKQRYEAIYK
ncbi:tetratricopeptide repeat protein, partial [Desulfococcaceae bacterium HSG7]|nr:tetratricopeptide repeat protein [Desulfococcaceae bacterium HSG7]